MKNNFTNFQNAPTFSLRRKIVRNKVLITLTPGQKSPSKNEKDYDGIADLKLSYNDKKDLSVAIEVFGEPIIKVKLKTYCTWDSFGKTVYTCNLYFYEFKFIMSVLESYI